MECTWCTERIRGTAR